MPPARAAASRVATTDRGPRRGRRRRRWRRRARRSDGPSGAASRSVGPGRHRHRRGERRGDVDDEQARAATTTAGPTLAGRARRPRHADGGEADRPACGVGRRRCQTAPATSGDHQVGVGHVPAGTAVADDGADDAAGDDRPQQQRHTARCAAPVDDGHGQTARPASSHPRCDGQPADVAQDLVEGARVRATARRGRRARRGGRSRPARSIGRAPAGPAPATATAAAAGRRAACRRRSTVWPCWARLGDLGPPDAADERGERDDQRPGLDRAHPQQRRRRWVGRGLGDDEDLEEPAQVAAPAAGADVADPAPEVDEADPVAGPQVVLADRGRGPHGDVEAAGRAVDAARSRRCRARCRAAAARGCRGRPTST